MWRKREHKTYFKFFLLSNIYQYTHKCKLVPNLPPSSSFHNSHIILEIGVMLKIVCHSPLRYTLPFSILLSASTGHIQQAPVPLPSCWVQWIGSPARRWMVARRLRPANLFLWHPLVKSTPDTGVCLDSPCRPRNALSSHPLTPKVTAAHLILPSFHTFTNKHSCAILFSVCHPLSVWTLNHTI